ncbi:MAG TPA: BF3164 family lipoprotein [Longimicrobium sp.]|jgi:hypothetical protein|uniref:BF3164 family lipoprotein n=1 Tax=Longimicrobium sp. TaxID=2029185 RepID=UPI002ED9FCF8
MASAAGSGRLRHTGRVLPLLALLAGGACGGGDGGGKASLGSVPIDVASVANAFTRNTPSVRGEPGDTMRMLRALGDTNSFGGIDRIVAVDDRLLVLDYLMDPHIAVVDVPSGRVVEQFGRNGAGPKEFKRPHWAFRAENPGEVWVFDPGNLRLSLIDLDADADHRIKRSMPVPPEAPVESPTWIGGSLVGNGVFPDYTLLVMDTRGTPVRRIAAAPPFSYRQVEHWVGLGILNRSFFAHQPSGGRIAIAYQWADRLDFFSADGGFLGTARGPRTTRPSYRIQDGKFFWNEETEMAYWAVAASDQHVLALHAGPAPDKPFEHFPSKLHVFTWGGEFVRELAFDRPVYGVAVAPDGRTLYAPYNEEDGSQRIGIWRLP